MQRNLPNSEELIEKQKNLAFIQDVKLQDLVFYPDKVSLVYDKNGLEYDKFINTQYKRLKRNQQKLSLLLKKEGIVVKEIKKEKHLINIEFLTKKQFGKACALIREKIHPILTKPLKRSVKRPRIEIDTLAFEMASSQPMPVNIGTSAVRSEPTSSLQPEVEGFCSTNDTMKNNDRAVRAFQVLSRLRRKDYTPDEVCTGFSTLYERRVANLCQQPSALAWAEFYGAPTSTLKEAFGEDIPSELLSAANNTRLSFQSRPPIRTASRTSHPSKRTYQQMSAAAQTTAPVPVAMHAPRASQRVGQDQQASSSLSLFRQLYGTHHSSAGESPMSAPPLTQTDKSIEGEDITPINQSAVFIRPLARPSRRFSRTAPNPPTSLHMFPAVPSTVPISAPQVGIPSLFNQLYGTHAAMNETQSSVVPPAPNYINNQPSVSAPSTAPQSHRHRLRETEEGEGAEADAFVKRLFENKY